MQAGICLWSLGGSVAVMWLLPRLLNLCADVDVSFSPFFLFFLFLSFPCSKEGMDWLSTGIFVRVNSHQHQFYAAGEGPLVVIEME